MWHANERVIAFPDSEESGWAGTVRHVDGQRNYVILDNGEDGWFLDAQLRPLKLIPGAPVLVAQPEGDELIQGILSTIDGETLGVRLPQGESLQATLRDLRFPRRTTKTGADERNWQIGDRVLARWVATCSGIPEWSCNCRTITFESSSIILRPNQNDACPIAGVQRFRGFRCGRFFASDPFHGVMCFRC